MATNSQQASQSTAPQSLLQSLLIKSIRFYQLIVSPLLMGSHCRFYPCCSNYAVEAVQVHGCLKGSLLIIKRILRCHPFSAGGFEPVPGKHHQTQK